MEKRSNTGLVVLAIVLVLALVGTTGYIIYDKTISKSAESNTSENTTAENDAEKINIDDNDNKASRYEKYLSNLKEGIKNNYNVDTKDLEVSNSIRGIFSETDNIDYIFEIDKNQILKMTSGEKEKVVDNNVLNMFLVNEGNGEWHSLYFIKEDGSLNKITLESMLYFNNEKVTVDFDKLKIESINKKYIVNVISGTALYDDGGGETIAMFIDIDGNIITD